MSTAHDKAVELIEKFRDKIDDFPVECNAYCLGREIDKKGAAKAFALIAVDEILNLNIPDFLSYQFWQEVKNEILNLK